jgi:hypothetical protein
VFAGIVQEPQIVWLSDQGDRDIKLTAISLESLCDIMVPAQIFVNKSPEFIFQAIMAPVIQASNGTIEIGEVTGSGVVIPLMTFDGTTSISDGARRLVQSQTDESGTNWAWGFDLRGEKPAAYFRPPGEATVTIRGRDIIFGTLAYTRTMADYRNRQGVQISADAFPPSSVVFTTIPADDHTKYTLPFPATEVVSAQILRGWNSAADGLLNAQPLPGQTITAGNITYTFAQVDETHLLDNKMPFLVAIGATAAETASNATDAINANPVTAGTAFSLPTWENDLVRAEPVGEGGTYIALFAKRAGAAGNQIPLASSAFGFVWVVFTLDPFPGMPSADLMTGGRDPEPQYAPVTLNVVSVAPDVASLSQPTLVHLPGTKEVTVMIPKQNPDPPPDFIVNPDPVPNFWVLEVQYRRLGADIITVEDSAAVAALKARAGGTGLYHRVLSATDIKDPATGLQLALRTLKQFMVFAGEVNFSTYRNLLRVGDFVAFDASKPSGAGAILNPLHLFMQEIQGMLVAGLNEREDYTVQKSIHCISGSILTTTVTYLAWWRGLARTSKVQAPKTPALPPPAPDYLTFSVGNATIADDVCEHHPLPQSYIARQVSVIPKLRPVLDLVGVILSDGVELFPFTIPADTDPDTVIVIPQEDWLVPGPIILPAGSIQTVNITDGDGAVDYRGVFTIRFDVLLTANVS